jgi:hypothetical protein
VTSKKKYNLKLGRACGFDGIADECIQQIPRRPLVYVKYLFNQCLRLDNSLAPRKETEVTILRTIGKGPKFPPDLRSARLLSTTGKVF